MANERPQDAAPRQAQPIQSPAHSPTPQTQPAKSDLPAKKTAPTADDAAGVFSRLKAVYSVTREFLDIGTASSRVPFQVLMAAVGAAAGFVGISAVGAYVPALNIDSLLVGVPALGGLLGALGSRSRLQIGREQTASAAVADNRIYFSEFTQQLEQIQALKIPENMKLKLITRFIEQPKPALGWDGPLKQVIDLTPAEKEAIVLEPKKQEMTGTGDDTARAREVPPSANKSSASAPLAE